VSREGGGEATGQVVARNGSGRFPDGKATRQELSRNGIVTEKRQERAHNHFC
jgi:hypothetical protein